MKSLTCNFKNFYSIFRGVQTEFSKRLLCSDLLAITNGKEFVSIKGEDGIYIAILKENSVLFVYMDYRENENFIYGHIYEQAYVPIDLLKICILNGWLIN